MKLRVNGQPAGAAEVVVYEDKFGDLQDFQVVPYELEFEKADFVARLEPVYDEWVKELKEDDAMVGRFQPRFTGAVDYPSFTGLLQLEPEQVLQFVKKYLAYDIVSRYVKDATEMDDEEKWVILNVDRVAVDAQFVTIGGKARAVREIERTMNAEWRLKHSTRG